MIIIPTNSGKKGEPSDVVATITVGSGPSVNDHGIIAVGNYVYVANYTGNSVSVIDPNSNSVVSTIGMGWAVNSFAIHPSNGTLYAAGRGGHIWTIDSITSATLRATYGAPWVINVKPDGSQIIGTSTDTYYAYAINTSGFGTSMFSGGHYYPQNATVSSTRFYLAAAPSGYSPQGIAIKDGNFSTIATAGDPSWWNSTYGMRVSADQSKLYVCTGIDSYLRVLSTSSNTWNTPYDMGAGPLAVAYSLSNVDWNRLYVTCADNTVKVVNPTNGSIVKSIPVGSNPSGVCVSPVNNCVYVANYGSGTVSVIG